MRNSLDQPVPDQNADGIPDSLQQFLGNAPDHILAAIDHYYGVDHPPELDTTNYAAPPQSIGQSIVQGFSGMENQPQAPPQGFGQGFLGGLTRGLGAAGTRAASQRQKIEAQAEKATAAKDARNAEATAAYRAQQNRVRDIVAGKAIDKAFEKPPKPELTPQQRRANAYNEALGTAQGKAAGTPGLPTAGAAADETFAEMARQYVRTGQFPRSLLDPKDRAAFRIYIHKNYPGADIAKNAATYKADQSSLAKQQSNLDQVTTSSNTLTTSIANLRGTLDQVPDWGSKVLNGPVRAVSAAFGNTAVPEFDQALHVVQNESGRILGGNWAGGGALLQSEKADMQKVQSGSYTRDQLMHVIDIIESDKIGRLNAGRKQVNKVKSRLDFAEGGQATPPPEVQWYGTIEPKGKAFTVKDPDGKVHDFSTRGGANTFIESVNEANGY